MIPQKATMILKVEANKKSIDLTLDELSTFLGAGCSVFVGRGQLASQSRQLQGLPPGCKHKSKLLQETSIEFLLFLRMFLAEKTILHWQATTQAWGWGKCKGIQVQVLIGTNLPSSVGKDTFLKSNWGFFPLRTFLILNNFNKFSLVLFSAIERSGQHIFLLPSNTYSMIKTWKRAWVY